MTSHSDLRVLIDVDGVLADFRQLFISAVMATGVRAIDYTWRPDQWDLSKALKLTKKEDDAVFSIINAAGVADDYLQPFPGAVEGVRRVAQYASVYFVTAQLRTSPTWVYDRDRWLIRHFGKEQGEKVVYTDHKYVVCGDYLVDDKPENCREWAAAWPSGFALHWTASYAKVEPDLLAVSSWEQILGVVRSRSPRLRPKEPVASGK